MINNEKKIGIIGLGYVGLPLAVEFGRQRPVVGFDLNAERIRQLDSGEDKTLEVTPQDLEASKLLEFTDNADHLEECEIYIITVPTPVDDVNRPDLNPLKSASEIVARYITAGNIVIFESTVFPGCTEEICVPILEQVSGLKYNHDFFCGYSPERVNPGDAATGLTEITKITSGSTEEIAEKVDKLYAQIINAGTFRATSIKVAEAAKVIENIQRDINIALVNELAMIFNKVGIDTKEVLEAAGSKWNFLPFKPGIVGGHCIGVDPYYLTYKAEELGYHPEMILAGRRINDNMPKYAAEMLLKNMTQNNIDISTSTIGILGITFKENCPDIRNSKVIDIIKELKKWNANLIVEDPWADPEEVKENYGIKLSKIDDTNKVDALLVAVAHREYREKSLEELRVLCKGDKPVLVDIKSLYNIKDAESSGFTIFRF